MGNITTLPSLSGHCDEASEREIIQQENVGSNSEEHTRECTSRAETTVNAFDYHLSRNILDISSATPCDMDEKSKELATMCDNAVVWDNPDYEVAQLASKKPGLMYAHVQRSTVPVERFHEIWDSLSEECAAGIQNKIAKDRYEENTLELKSSLLDSLGAKELKTIVIMHHAYKPDKREGIVVVECAHVGGVRSAPYFENNPDITTLARFRFVYEYKTDKDLFVHMDTEAQKYVLDGKQYNIGTPGVSVLCKENYVFEHVPPKNTLHGTGSALAEINAIKEAGTLLRKLASRITQNDIIIPRPISVFPNMQETQNKPSEVEDKSRKRSCKNLILDNPCTTTTCLATLVLLAYAAIHTLVLVSAPSTSVCPPVPACPVCPTVTEWQTDATSTTFTTNASNLPNLP